jgi:hypothetical protein
MVITPFRLGTHAMAVDRRVVRTGSAATCVRMRQMRYTTVEVMERAEKLLIEKIAEVDRLNLQLGAQHGSYELKFETQKGEIDSLRAELAASERARLISIAVQRELADELASARQKIHDKSKPSFSIDSASLSASSWRSLRMRSGGTPMESTAIILEDNPATSSPTAMGSKFGRGVMVSTAGGPDWSAGCKSMVIGAFGGTPTPMSVVSVAINCISTSRSLTPDASSLPTLNLMVRGALSPVGPITSPSSGSVETTSFLLIGAPCASVVGSSLVPLCSRPAARRRGGLGRGDLMIASGDALPLPCNDLALQPANRPAGVAERDRLRKLTGYD